MSYLDLGKDKSSLPVINSARRIRVLEEEVARLREVAATGRISPAPIISSDTRRVVTELQDKTRAYREELQKKDSLIQHLVSLESAPKIPRAPDSYRLDSLYISERNSLETCRSELAAMQVKYERSQNQIRELQNEMEAKDIRIRELENLRESNHETESRLSEMVTALRQQLGDYESRAQSYETVASRGEVTISTLQQQFRDATEKIAELETRLKTQLESKERIEATAISDGKRFSEFLSQLSSLLYTEPLEFTQISFDHVVRKLTDLVQENAMLKGKILTMNEHLNETSLESKASRETIMRLVSEVGREQKVTTKYTTEVENLRLERDNALASRAELEREIHLLNERLEANHRSLEATRQELQLKEGRYASVEREYRDLSQTVNCSSTQFALFREQIANLLSLIFTDIVPSEECLRETIKRLTTDKKEWDLRMEEYELRVKELTQQLNQELGLHKDMASRAKRFEVESFDLAERLRSAEGELAAGDVLRDGFKFDKEKYLRGLQKLGEVMKMDRISLDLGLDLTLDALVARAEQLIKLEAGALAGKSSEVYNLHRKLKALKEQLSSKDLHIDLLRKKMTSLEERIHGKIDVEKHRDVETLRVHKLEKLVEKYKLQLQDSRQEVQNLKAQLLGSGDLKVHTLEQRKDIEELSRQIEELEEVRRRQSRKIAHLKSTVEKNESEIQEKNLVTENSVQALSSELRTTKNAMDTLKYREKQLVDFRTVVARMLGLEIDTLAVPDYEIITRLEKLIQAHHTTAFTTLSLEEALSNVESDGEGRFKVTVEANDPVVDRSRQRSRRRANRAYTRSRSLSPMKRDPHRY